MAEIENEVQNENKVVADNKTASDSKPAKVKAKKPGIFSKLGKLIRESKSEAKKVTWPSKKATTKNTILVIVSLVIIGILFGLFDTAFQKLVAFIMDLY